MKITHTKTLFSLASAALLPLSSFAIYASDEEWYDPTDWFDGDNVEYREADTNESDSYQDLDNLDIEDNEYTNDSSALNDSEATTYVYTAYVISPKSSDGEKEWKEKKTSQNVARQDFNRAQEDREYVRSEESKSSHEKMNRGDKFQSNRSNSEQQSNKFSQDSDKMLVRGKIVAFSAVDARGSSKDNDLIKLKLDNGRSAVVDLGNDSAKEDLNLNSGDKILIRGTRDKLDGKVILVAEEITVGQNSEKSHERNQNELNSENRNNSKSRNF